MHLHVVPRTGGDLARVLASFATHSLGPLLRPTPRARLDEVAALLRAALSAQARNAK